MDPSPKTAPSEAGEAERGIVGFVRWHYLTADKRWLGVFRILFGTILCVDGIRRWAHARAFYSNDGLLPNHYSLFRPMGRDVFSIYHAFSTLGEVNVAFALTVLVFFLFTIGYRTKLFHILAALCITSLNARNIMVENGGTVVTNILTIWTLFLPLGSRLSVDAVRRSLAAHHEHSATELNERAAVAPAANRHVSLVVLALMLQWSVIYFFNYVHKSGHGWRDGTALYWFWHQDRIATWLSVWARTHVPLTAVKAMTYGALATEATLAWILLFPFWQTWRRRIALLLALGLHGMIAACSRLGPFSYVMIVFFVLLLGDDDWQLIGRWFGRPSRARTVIYDADCGVCLLACRVLKRLDPFQRLTFVGNDDADAIPSNIGPETLERTVVVVLPDGRHVEEERALFEVLRALPFGILAGIWLRVPGLSLVFRALYRAFARNRLHISAWLGLGACGLPAPPTADEPGDDATTPDEPGAARTLRGDLTSIGIFVREAMVIVLAVTLASQLALENAWLRQRVKVHQPEWMADIVNYPRIFQGWSMFAPEPPYDDGHLVVDGRTIDGRKLDPFTGKPPDFDPFTPTGWGLDQLWCDYNNRIRFPGNAGARQFLRDYLVNLWRYAGRPKDRLVAFDVWWVQDDSPPPGQLRGKPGVPERLLSFGRVDDSGATPWLAKTGAPLRLNSGRALPGARTPR